LYIVRVFVLGLDIPPQSRPADGKLKLFASEKNAFLVGNSTLVLDKDYFPAVEIQLEHDTSAVVRGVVLDDHNRSAAGAHVSIPGYPQVAVTDEMGNFVLPAHAADGQIVQVRAQKDQQVGTLSVPAGTPVELVVRHP
jgi:predicted ribosome-associated RNA-binding protein Tma20